MYRKAKKIKLLNTDLLTTMNLYSNDVYAGGLIKHTKGELQAIQEVLSVSEYAASRGLKVGDLVQIDLSKYVRATPAHNYSSAQERTLAPDGKKMDYKLIPPILEVDDKPYLHIEYSDIEYIITDWEELEETGLVLPESKIITEC